MSEYEVIDLHYYRLRPDVGSDNIEEVYSSKVKWVDLKDNHLFYFRDNTYGILKKFRMADMYCNTSEDPIGMSVVTPFSRCHCLIGHDGHSFCQHFTIRDCVNIIKVAKTDFRRNDRLAENEGTYSFHFGQCVYDARKNECAVVVGQTKHFAYIVTEASIKANRSRRCSVKPILRKIGSLQAVPTFKVLNYKVVKECASMEDYVVYNSERPYTMICDVEEKTSL